MSRLRRNSHATRFSRGFQTGLVLGATLGVAGAALLPVVTLAAIAVGAALWLAGRARLTGGGRDYAYVRGRRLDA